MKYLTLVTGITAITFFSGCGNNSTGETMYIPKNDSSAVVTLPVDTSGVPVTNTIFTPNAPGIATPVLTTQQPGQATPITAAGLNPEHGKPGHRCDIAVGAPLNSAAQPQPATTTTPIVTNTPEISAKNATVVTTTKPVAAGMNPEHGKPGHRCEIAVGAPLDSKPAEATPIITTPTKSETPVSPLLPGTTTPSKPVAFGMNPEHGKPGHRCDIGVGEPLPKQ